MTDGGVGVGRWALGFREVARREGACAPARRQIESSARALATATKPTLDGARNGRGTASSSLLKRLNDPGGAGRNKTFARQQMLAKETLLPVIIGYCDDSVKEMLRQLSLHRKKRLEMSTGGKRLL